MAMNATHNIISPRNREISLRPIRLQMPLVVKLAPSVIILPHGASKYHFLIWRRKRRSKLCQLAAVDIYFWRMLALLSGVRRIACRRPMPPAHSSTCCCDREMTADLRPRSFSRRDYENDRERRRRQAAARQINTCSMASLNSESRLLA